MRVVIGLLALVLGAAGQVTTGSVSGFVLDPSRRPIPNASVTVSDSRRSLTRSATTDVTGYYRVADLPPSAYKLSATATGFVTTQSPDVQVAVDAQMRMDFSLAISGKEQSLTVHATATAVTSESSELGTVISRDRIAGLPLNQRDFCSSVDMPSSSTSELT